MIEKKERYIQRYFNNKIPTITDTITGEELTPKDIIKRLNEEEYLNRLEVESLRDTIRKLQKEMDNEYLTIQTSAQTLLTNLTHKITNKKTYKQEFQYEDYILIKRFLTALTILDLNKLDQIRKEIE